MDNKSKRNSGQDSKSHIQVKAGPSVLKKSISDKVADQLRSSIMFEPRKSKVILHRGDQLREEIIASHLMKELTAKYGTKGKSAKEIFLQAFDEEIQGIGVGKHVSLKVCEDDPDFLNDTSSVVKIPTKEELIAKAHKISHPLGQIMERPAAMVTQSAFLAKLDEQIRNEISRLNCGAPTYEMYWLFEEGKTESAHGSTLSVRDALHEPEEKLMARLKVYRRAFSAVILHFEALRPILREIKRVYEFVLNHRERQLREAKTVTRNIYHAEKALDDKRELVRFEGYAQIAELEKQCMLLMTHVEKQDAAINTMTTILLKLETSLSEEHDIRRESEDSRKLLIVEINELRRKMGMGPRLASGVVQVEEQEEKDGEVDAITKDDPLILRTALETCRKNLSDAQQRLTVLEADYADVIPRHEFESLKKDMDDVQESQKKTDETYGVLESQVQGLKDQIEKLISERDTLQELVNNLRTKATPRPSWTKVAEHIDGGLPYWETIYKGKSSNEIVDRLVEELTGKKVSAIPEYREALGIATDIPRHLRFDGKIRVRYLTRRDMAVIVQDVWQTRLDQLDLYRKQNNVEEEDDSESFSYSAAPQVSTLPEGPSEPVVIQKFPDFFADYFEERYHLPNLRMEWTYNLVDGCKQMAIDGRLTQFLGILEGNVDEAVYHLVRSEATKLYIALTKKSSDLAPEGTGNPYSVPLSDFNKILQELFPEKTEEQFHRLSRAAAKQSSAFAEWSAVRFAQFFKVTDEGLVGEFIEEFAKEVDEDRMRYVYDILNELLAELGVSLESAEREDDPAGDTDVSMTKVYSAMTSVDPTITDEKLGAALSWIFLGESTLPGTPPKGVKLVEYLKSRVSRSGYDSEEEDDHDDDDFERAIQDIQNLDTAFDEDISAKQRKNKVKKTKVASLRLVVQRLKGGALLRQGLKYSKTEDTPPAATTSEADGTEGESTDLVHHEEESEGEDVNEDEELKPPSAEVEN